MKICVIAPVILDGPPQDSVKEFARAARFDCETEMVFLDRGPESIESEYEDILAAPDVVLKALEASKRGFDAIVVSCMLDPGVDQTREMLDIPVLGPAQTAMHVASMLGDKFSIITVLDRLIGPLYKRANIYGLSNQLASVRAINVQVLELEKENNVTKLIIDESICAIKEDHANVIVFGCTGMAGMANAVQEGLRRMGFNVPVIDPGVTALKIAEAMVDMRISHSKMSYPNPNKVTDPKYRELFDKKRENHPTPKKWQVKEPYKSVVLTPIINKDPLIESLNTTQSVARPDNLVGMELINQGPGSIESRFDIMLASPYILKKAQQLERARSKSLIINCMADPALDATREILNIPVLGVANTVLHFASILALKFTIIVPLDRNISMMNELVHSYGLQDKVASIRSINQSVELLELSSENTEKLLFKEIKEAIKSDGAEAIVFGCTGFSGFLEDLKSDLKLSDIDIPVLDPSITTVKLAEAIVDLNLLHSKYRFPIPPSKLIRGF